MNKKSKILACLMIASMTGGTAFADNGKDVVSNFTFNQTVKNLNTRIDGAVETANTAKQTVEKKADKTFVEGELGKKADQTAVDEALGNKADKETIDAELPGNDGPLFAGAILREGDDGLIIDPGGDPSGPPIGADYIGDYIGVYDADAPGTGNQNTDNYLGEGSRGGISAIAIGKYARVGTWKTIQNDDVGTVNEEYNFYYGKGVGYRLTSRDLQKGYFGGADHSIAVGHKAKAEMAGGIALGADTVAGKAGAVAIGQGASVSVADGIALGADSVASRDKEIAGYLIEKKSDNQGDFVWTATKGSISIGDAARSVTRQITGVAAGSEDTDAVNVAQLKAVNKKVDAFSDTNTKITGGTIAYETNGMGTITLSDSDNSQVTLSGLKNTYTQSGEYKKEEKSLVFSRNDDTKYTVDMSGLVNEMNTVATEGDTHVKAETVQVTNNTVSLTLVNGKDEEQGTVVINDIASKTELEQKANKDASNIEVNKWSEKLGIGEVKEGNTNLVTGDTVYNAIQSGVSAAATTVESADEYIQVTPPEEGKHNYKVGLTVNGQVKKDDTGLVTGGVVFDAVDQKANKDASNIEGENKIKWQEKLGDSQVEKDNKGLVNGGTLFDEVRVEKDGNYIKSDNSVAKNTMALDAQVGTNATNIATNTTNIANNTTNIAKNATGIANNTMNINSLSNRMNDVGAGAAALAGLHPLDYDPDYKWDFTAAYGHYAQSDAFAMGAFYRPNSQYMVSAGAVIDRYGDMYNIGISAKIGRGGNGNIGTSRTALIHEVRNLKAQTESQNQKISAMKEENDVIKQDNADLRKQVQLLLQKMNEWEEGHSMK